MKKLTRDEMKNVVGGLAAPNGTCTYTLTPGSHAVGGSCSGTADQCQVAADSWCWSHDECLDVDCR